MAMGKRYSTVKKNVNLSVNPLSGIYFLNISYTARSWASSGDNEQYRKYSKPVGSHI